MRVRKSYWALLVFTLLIAAVYLALPTRAWTPEGVSFALSVERPESLNNALLQPSHLIYLPFGRAMYVLAERVDAGVRAMTVLQIVNSVAAACCVFALGEIALEWTGSALIALLAAALLAFSAAWWKFSTDAGAWILATLFLTLAFRFLLPWQPARPLSVAALHSTAMLFHELAVLFLPVALLGLAMQCEGRLRRWLAAFTYVVAALVMTLAPHCYAVSRTGDLTPRALFEWLADHGAGAHFSASASNIAAVAESHVRLFLGGRWTLARHFQRMPSALAVAAFALFCVLILRRPEITGDDASPGWRDTRAVLLLSLAWIAPYFAFLAFFEPRETFNRLLYAPAIVLALTALAVQRRWLLAFGSRRAIAIGLAALAVWNFCLFIYPHAQTAANPALVAAEDLHSRLRRDAIIYHSTFSPDDRLVLYISPQTRWMQLARFDVASVARAIAEAASSNRDVWLDGSALTRVENQPGGPEWIAQHTVSDFDRRNGASDIRFRQLHP